MAALAVATAAVAVLTGCSPAGSLPGGHPSLAPSSTPTPPPAAFSTAVPQQRATVPPVAPAAAAPARVAVDWAGVTAPVRPEGVDDQGAMALPPDPAVAGWYRYGAAPAATQGTVVLAAHVDAVGYGIGPFAHLRDVPEGRTITVTDTAGAETRWRIDSVSLLEKRGLPWDRIFRTDGDRRLVLVTCGGVFDEQTHHYESNLVITATPVS
ncbi:MULTISPECIES: class F sortase [unclassified Curtobacterium]|uniref:class F sortase n=1 Tax=unclassified Curtobacterium TaxID=257496 RepID=UPI0025B513E1|nr:class F sortase [Curtobacterium sp. 458]WJX99449.1 class F sortase [Curtobacterium sp. 458]